MKETALIIFARKPELGKVKTRLAAGIGEPAALEVYLRLLDHTRQVAIGSTCDIHVFLTVPIEDSFWEGCDLHQQGEGDLGQKMQAAFSFLFTRGYAKVVIIGSDCPDLSSADIKTSFEMLHEVQVVIGPAFDGGYYLLGMNKIIPELFEDIAWSTSSVLDQTQKIAHKLGLATFLLPPKADIDLVDDLPLNWR